MKQRWFVKRKTFCVVLIGHMGVEWGGFGPP